MQFSSPVISGTGKGKGIGFPTLNLDLDPVPSILEDGVYVCFARLGEHGIRLPALLHFGNRPTLGSPRSCEVHVIDQLISLAPQTISVEIVHKIRDVKKFDSIEQLTAQLQSDRNTARMLLCTTC